MNDPGEADLEAMHRPAAAGVTALLRAAHAGDPGALDALFAAVYDELRGLAHRVRGGRSGETLCTTALVHEAYVKLLPSANLDWEGRGHFFAVAAGAMRQVLVEAARRRGAAKRGGGAQMVTLGDQADAHPVDAEQLLALDDALRRLAELDERQARVVECRFFGGLTASETADALTVSVPTVERDWRSARAWLTRELSDEPVRRAAARRDGGGR